MARTWFLKESRRPSTKKLILQGNTLPELMAERQRWSLKNKPLEPGETKVDRIRKLRGINRDIAQEWGRQDKGWALVVNGQYVKPQDWDMPAEIITPTGLVNDLRTASMVMRNKLFSGYQLVPIGIDEADEIRGYLR
jgi:hypothetical protein